MIQLRLIGLPGDVQSAICDLHLSFRVTRVSKPYDARNDPDAVIRHVDIELRPDEPDPATSPPE